MASKLIFICFIAVSIKSSYSQCLPNYVVVPQSNAANINYVNNNGQAYAGGVSNGANIVSNGFNGASIVSNGFNGANIVSNGFNGANIVTSEIGGANIVSSGINGNTVIASVSGANIPISNFNVASNGVNLAVANGLSNIDIANFANGFSFGGNGVGEVSVLGELPISGSTVVTGTLPVFGTVQFTGNVPTSGLVSVINNPCCNSNYY